MQIDYEGRQSSYPQRYRRVDIGEAFDNVECIQLAVEDSCR